MNLLQSFSIMEGFAVKGSRPQRNNNPLDLRWGAETKAFGATHGDRLAGPDSAGLDGYSGFAVFPDVPTGFDAGRRWLSVPAKLATERLPGFYFDPNGTTLVGGYLGATLAQVVYRFAPPTDGNDSEAYTNGLCLRTTDYVVTRETVLTLELLAVPVAS